jgi:hypothetical protein
LFTAAGIAWLAGWPVAPGEAWHVYKGWKRIRPLLVFSIVLVLVLGNLFYYTPIRLQGMHALYGMERADLQPFQTPEARQLAPALIIVHPDRWMDYGVLLELENPFLDTPFIFVYTRGARADEDLTRYFPDRAVYHYYPPGEPHTFYTAPKPE